MANPNPLVLNVSFLDQSENLPLKKNQPLNGTRTRDHLVKSQTLYRLSYQGVCYYFWLIYFIYIMTLAFTRLTFQVNVSKVYIYKINLHV
jgi:hypothetical protein